MRLLIILFFFISISTSTIAQALSGMELLDKSIEYHDPNSKWNQFNGSFSVSMESPNRPLRKSKITLDLTRSFFELSVQIGENQWKASLKGFYNMESLESVLHCSGNHKKVLQQNGKS